MKNVRTRSRRSNQTCAANNPRGGKGSSRLSSNATNDPSMPLINSEVDSKRLSRIFLNLFYDINRGNKMPQEIDKAFTAPQETPMPVQSVEEKKTEMSEESVPIKSHKQSKLQAERPDVNKITQPTQEPRVQQSFFEEAANFLHAFGGQNPDLDKLVEYLNYCYAHKLLKPEHIQALGELIMLQRAQLAQNEEMVENPLVRSDSGDRDYPNNCMHVRICYFIWDKQNKAVIDPTELGRKYKELYFAVLLLEKKWYGGSVRSDTRQVNTRKPSRASA